MSSSLRERTRRAVQREIGEAAVTLIVERGYDATTIDDIAAAVGMSQRSVFRYFATKEDIIVGKLDLAGDEMAINLRARPAGEPVWTALRHVFDVMGAPDYQKSTRAIQQVVFETPALMAVYLRKLHSIQETVAAILRDRAETPYEPEDPTPAALTNAAFGCFVAAQQTWLASTGDDPLEGYLDRAMAALIPSA
jgi:AcrR family transcriptional regulator